LQPLSVLTGARGDQTLAKNRKKQLRALWLQVHKWIGLTLAVLIIPISLTGSALVWHDWLDAKLEPQRYAKLGPANLPPSKFAAASRDALMDGERLSELRFNNEGTAVVAVATKASSGGSRPVRTSLWLDPRDASVIDRASGNGGAVQVMHVLHGSLMIPGWGRTIVGWVGAFMFVSCLTGIWLWWPLSGTPAAGLRWKRRKTINANIHYMAGFWVLFPLAMLSFTGAWISFPKVFSQFENRPAVPSPNREQAIRAKPLESTATSVDEAVAAATQFATGALASISWPTDQKAEWRIGFERQGGPAVVTVFDATAKATKPKGPQPETLARKMRRWHDGTGMGPIWQLVIFVGGLIPAILSITGIIIWWRARKPRSRSSAYRRANATA
jgi:uncharacterized iron-regulated membrane protein